MDPLLLLKYVANTLYAKEKVFPCHLSVVPIVSNICQQYYKFYVSS